MSECVVRMEFRKSCLDCDLHQIVYGDSYADTDVYCFKEKRLVGKRFGPTKDLARPDWCPIICALPESHGRLVEESDVVRLIDKWFDAISLNPDILIDSIKSLPTIVPAERSET